MFSLESLLLLLGLFVTVSDGETSTCLTVYEEGGAPAVFQSQKCPRWKLSTYASTPSSTERCQIAMHQGRRYHQEDRALCVLDLRIPFPGKVGIKEVVVGVVAVFDGHNGVEASDMASNLLLEYFVLHTYFLLDSTYSAAFKSSIGRLSNRRYNDGVSQLIDWDQVLGHYDLDHGRHSVLESFANSSHLEILKEALLRAIHDIDATFSKEASRKKLVSGSTATIILLADGQILVANIGDSKALLCSEQVQSPAQAKATYFRLYRKERSSGAISRIRNDGKSKSKLISSSSLVHLFVQELTRDHHPNRDDERLRVESAGGYVLEWGGVPRVNGQLAVSRAIGDVAFKSYGVISAPELTDWRTLTANDSYLVAASDGVFEKLSSQDVCDLIWEVQQGHDPAGFRCTYSVADCIVNSAVEKGSMDNVATVVVPLASTDFPLPNVRKNKVDKSLPQLGSKKLLNDLSVKEIGSDVVQVSRAHPVMAKFERLLVEGKHMCIGCFYLSENLDEHTYYASLVERVDQDLLTQMHNVDHEGYNVPKALPGALDHYFSGPINLYHDNNLCFHLGMDDSTKYQCPNGEGFASFVGLLESIPIHDGSPKNGSFENEIPNSSYVLKKRFGRGSYGEVWLAFHWNCDQGSNSSGWSEKDNNMSSNAIRFNSQVGNMGSYSDNNHSSPRDNNLFILKRVMVEKGAAVYLSGLREKYFGEVFLNASKCLGGYPSAPQTLNVNHIEPRLGIHARIEPEETAAHEIGSSWSFEDLIRKKFRLHGGLFEKGLDHIARFVESFESRSNEIWLVFHFEGISLSKLIYTLEVANKDSDAEGAEDKKHAQMLRPSKWWHWLKTTEAGREEMRSITWQLLLALKSCHDRNITHRDIKPENMVICFTDQITGKCLNKISDGDTNFKAKMRVIDFGSAMDEFTVKHLYGTAGPSRAEQTSDYSPPEALLNSSWHHGAMSKTLKYDIWSVGVVILELILGSPNVFQISTYTRTLLDQHLEGWNEGLKELAYKLRSFMELCILLPGDFSKHQRAKGQVGDSPASWKCSEEFFSNQIKSRDPLKLGFTDVWLLRLVRDLLQWDPEERLSIDEALRHPYFKSRPKS